MDIFFFWCASEEQRRNIWKDYWNKQKLWLCNWQFFGVWIFSKTLQTNCKQIEQTNWARKP